jgi:hypothetical protein
MMAFSIACCASVFSPAKGSSLISAVVGSGESDVGKGYAGEGGCEITERRARICCSKALESDASKPEGCELDGMVAIIEEWGEVDEIV